MSFGVQPADLSAFAKQLERASADANHALEYMRRECSIGTFDKGPISALASTFGGGHDGVMANVESTLKKLHRILDSSQREMARSASYYEHTDRSEASKLDSTYPASKR
ncbi:WXG100 family type VII secretion target [Streptomyces lydicus]|uniref:WXG100 family type VII secretion target n=1 Tax=Streptomyces lydicus TaxID=47763 RepID=UPI0015D56A7D